jgi:hypothetical protein
MKHSKPPKPSQDLTTASQPIANAASSPAQAIGDEPSATLAVDELTQTNLRLTRQLVIWTAVLAIVGAVTAGVAFVQWRALLKADGTTREAFTAVQRPFVVAVNLEANQDQPPYWTFRTILENTGSTPTKNMTVTSAASFSVPILPDSPADPAELKKQPSEPYPTATDHFIGPHGKVAIDAISLVTKTLEDMADQRADFFVYGIARYNDQFGETKERSTKFCFVVRPFKGLNGLSLNNRGLCHHWNCGDEDCDRDKLKYEAERTAMLQANPKAAEISRPIPIASVIPFYPTPLIKAQ